MGYTQSKLFRTHSIPKPEYLFLNCAGGTVDTDLGSRLRIDLNCGAISNSDIQYQF